MGQLAFFKMFLIVAMSSDVNDNRKHVHIFKRGGRHRISLAKIWVESNGEKKIEIDYSYLSSKENEMLIDAIDKNWMFIISQIDKTFKGEKTIMKNL